MKAHRLWSLGVPVLLLMQAALPAPAGAGRPAAQEIQAITPPIQHEVAVVLKLVHVHVTDKKGDPVRDLAREDFAVTDNGQPVTITAFEKHDLEPAAAPEPATNRPDAPVDLPAGRKYFLFFDFAYNNVRGILKARTAALHFLDTIVRPGDEVAVLTFAAIRGLAFHEYLTPDHARVRKVVEKIGHSDVMGRATQIEDQYWRLVQELPGTGAGAAIGLNMRAEAEASRQESKSMAQKYMLKMTALARSLRLVEGPKDFLFFSTGIPNSLIYGYTPDNARFRSDTGTVAGDHVLRRQNEEMYREFGASGCSFYAFDTRESAKEASLFAYDEQTFATGSRAMGTAIDPTNVFKDDKATGLNSLKRFTDTTGGRYYSNINRYEKNIEKVQALTGSYYVLGYAITERWDGRYHEIKVEVGRKGCEVRTQAGYFNPKPYSEYSDLEKQIHLFDLALNERAFSRLPVQVPMGAYMSAAEGISRLAVLARIPSEVTAKLAGRRVELVTLFFDAQGDLGAFVREEADLTPLRGREMAFAAGAVIKPGDYACRLVIRDMDSGQSIVASAKAAAGQPAAAGIQLGTPLLLEARTGCALLSPAPRKGRTGFPWPDVYPYDSTIYAPVIADMPAAPASLQAVIPCAVPGSGPADLALSASLIEAATGERKPLLAAVSSRTRKGPLEITTLELGTAGIAPGTYYLHIYAEDRASGALGHAFTTLVIPAR